MDQKSGHNLGAAGRLYAAGLIAFALALPGLASAADSIQGQVLGAGAPIAKSTVTLWSASTDAPKQLAQTQTGDDGRFTLAAEGARSPDTILYIVAKGGEPSINKTGGDNPAIALMTVLGSKPPAKVVINELTTVASAFTAARFINGESISGNPLGLRIAAGNVANFVDPGNRRVGQGTSRSAQQHPDHDACELRHSRLADHRLLHRGQ